MSDSFQSIHDRARLLEYLRQDPYLYLYCLGDLDDFYWKHTVWYGLTDPTGRIAALAMGYFSSHPVFLAYACPGNEERLKNLLGQLRRFLPRKFYLHASGGISSVLAPDYSVESTQRLSRMALRRPQMLAGVEAEGELLCPADLDEVEEFYEIAYPGNWFEARMLESGQYFGIRRGGRLAAVAGVHVYSPDHRVAALGNIATHPEWRGQGLSTGVTAKLCRSLLQSVDTIGLNVTEENRRAQDVYERLGFGHYVGYEESVIESARS